MIRAFREADLPALLELQHALAPRRRHLSPEALKSELTDGARRHGKNVAIAADGDRIRGFLGWVAGDAGEFFGAPFVTGDASAARLLVDELVKQGKGSKWIRVSAYPSETEKYEALGAAGFCPQFDFIDFEVRPEKAEEPPLPPGITEETLLKASPSEYRDLHNDSFRHVDNAPAIDEEHARETLTSPLFHPSYSLLWRDTSGRPLAFTLARPNGELDAIGVASGAQGRNCGTILFRRVLARMAHDELDRCFTIVSSRNEGSLRLHKRLGIPEVERRTVWQK